MDSSYNTPFKKSEVYNLFVWNIRQLTISWRRPLSYRNQSIDLQSKSMDWFLYDNDLHHERVKGRTTRFFFSSASVLHFIHLVYSCPYLGIDLFMSYLCDVFFFFSLIFIAIDHIT